MLIDEYHPWIDSRFFEFNHTIAKWPSTVQYLEFIHQSHDSRALWKYFQLDPDSRNIYLNDSLVSLENIFLSVR